MSKTYAMDVVYGMYQTEVGTFVSLCAEQGSAAKNRKELATHVNTTTAGGPDLVKWGYRSVTIPQALVESIQKDAAQQGSGLDSLLAKVVRERDFQQQKAKEYGEGIFKNDILSARYDQAAKILGWVIKTIQEEQGTVS